MHGSIDRQSVWLFVCIEPTKGWMHSSESESKGAARVPARRDSRAVRRPVQ